MRAPLLALLLLLPATLRAQDESGESSQARLQRDQARVGQRLTGLREKMERLAQRYSDEGRTRNAELLREALVRFDEQKLLDVQREVQRGLEQGSLSTVERQDALAAGLEAVYAVLRDRRDVEELQRQAELARQGLAELGVLAENERRLLASTRATSDTPAGLLKQAMQTANDMLEALKQAAQAAQLGADAESRLGDAGLARQLAEQQRALAADDAPSADTQALLQQALALLREHLGQPTPAAEDASLAPEALASAQSARDLAGEAAADAAQEMQAAKDALEAAARGEPAPPRPSTAGDAAPKPGDAAPETSAPKPGSAAPESSAPKPGESPPSGESGKPPSGTPRNESSAMQAARERMEAAAARLDEAGEDLDRSERSLAAARNRARAATQASADEAAKAGEQLDDTAQRLEAAEPEAGPEMLDRTRALLEELSKLQQAAQAGQMDQAAKAAQAGKLSLDQLLEMLGRRQAGAKDTPREAPTQAALDALAQQQAELQRQFDELMSRLKELPDQKFQQPAGAAKQAMQGAQDALKRGDPREGGTREQEAAEQMEQAAKKLSGASDRYEQLRQDEVLFRLNEDLTALLARQREASSETRDLDEAREGAERLSRSQRRAAGRLAEEERDLGTQSEALRAALQADEALAFEHALLLTRDDLSATADKLADEQTGWAVQMLQGDVEQRLSDLLAVLAAEHERRAEALKQSEKEPEQGQPPGGQGKEPLVPTVAELLLIQRLEQAALARLDAFARESAARGPDEEPSDVERDMLQRWAGEHQGISELFRRKFQPPMEVKVPPPEAKPEGGPP